MFHVAGRAQLHGVNDAGRRSGDRLARRRGCFQGGCTSKKVDGAPGGLLDRGDYAAGEYLYLVVVSGTAATGEDGRALHPGDTYQQTVVCFERALEALDRFGAAAAHVVRTRVYLTPDADRREAVHAHHELFECVDPTNTTLFVAGLMPEGALEVELDAWVECGEALA